MKKVVFGVGCMITGMLVCLVMVILASKPEIFGLLNLLGRVILWLGVGLSLFGAILCVANISEDA